MRLPGGYLARIPAMEQYRDNDHREVTLHFTCIPCTFLFLSNIERLEDLAEILADDEIDEEMQKGMRDEFDEMKTAFPDIFPNNPPPRKNNFLL